MLNRITDEERAQILKNLDAAAHDAAENSSLKQDAQQQVSQRLTELMSHNGQSLQINWLSEKPRQTAP